MTDIQRRSQIEPVDVEMGDWLEDMICDLEQQSFSVSTCPYVWYNGKWFEEVFVSEVQKVIDTVVRGVKSS